MRQPGEVIDHIIGERPDGKLGLVWQATFESPSTANAFSAGLVAQEPCWAKVRGDGPGSVAEPVQVLPLGRTVVLVRGATATESAALVASLSRSLPAAPSPTPPLGRIALAPLRPAPLATQHGHLEGDRYVDPGLALTADVPPGFAPNLSVQGVGLSLQRATEAPGGGFFSYIASPPSAEFRRQTFESFIGGMNSTLGGGQHFEEVRAEAPVKLPLGQGFEKRWRVSDTQVEVRAAILPACGGHALYLLGSVSSNPDSRDRLGRWMESFRVDPQAKAPICDSFAAGPSRK